MIIKSDKLLAMIEHQNTNQTQIADRAGVSKQTITAWIKGERNPGIENVRRLASALNCSVEDIAEYETSLEDNASSRHSVTDDVIKGRIDEIYSGLDRAGRAELLALAEQIAKRDGVTLIPQALPSRNEEKPASGIRRKHGPLPTMVVDRVMRELDNPTQTPRGKETGIPLVSIEIECSTCHKIFYAPRLQRGQEIACPACGTHVIVP